MMNTMNIESLSRVPRLCPLWYERNGSEDKEGNRGGWGAGMKKRKTGYRRDEKNEEKGESVE